MTAGFAPGSDIGISTGGSGMPRTAGAGGIPVPARPLPIPERSVMTSMTSASISFVGDFALLDEHCPFGELQGANSMLT